MPVPPPPPPPPLPPPPPPVGAPPPPPPPGPPISTDAPSLRKTDLKGRSALLADIQQGTRLRKVTQINDRSAPQIEGSKGTNKDGGSAGSNARGGNTPPALGDLFAGGFPVLRPAGQRDVAGGKTGQGPGSRAPSPRLPTKAVSGPLPAPASPRLGNASEAHSSPRPIPPRPSPFPPPPLPGENSSGNEAPPPLPPKSPSFQTQKALPTPPGAPGPQAVLQKKRRGPGTSGGKLNPPPAPPARSPTTELSSKSQQPGGQLRNGGQHVMDDFESKFTFHSMEDFPPPDEFKPCQKIYPSKVPRSHTPGSWLQAEAAGQSSDDIKSRNSQLSLKALR
ncbi:WAS/WASL-interacting protein family member 3 isoform X1 [Cricetulus griseus]|uniref:WAS/WASL-interacting protein family member 3 isoform X1 n=1 Tax=Cricetulus griseus TaxID=10029 RepID=UPI00022F574F|nr:WAS/WASL-interacting protein family member 3 isoform X1 [Cricetulus griseus]